MRHHSLSPQRGRKVPLYPKRGRATEDICPQCRDLGNLSLRLTREMDFPPPHFQARPAGLSILRTGEARAWGAVLAEEKGLELKVEQEQ